MFRSGFSVIGVLAVVLLAACGASNTSSNTTNTPAVTTSSSPSASPAAAATGDPCQLVTINEASALAGVTFNAANTDKPSAGTCVYGAQTTNVFAVIVAVASSASAANADWSQEEAKVQADLQKAVSNVPGLTVNFSISDITLSGFDRAATGSFSVSGNGVTVNGSAIYTLKGADFFAMSDLTANQPASSASALEAQAQTSRGRLP